MASEALDSMKDQLENISAGDTQPVHLTGDGRFVSGSNGIPISNYEVLASLHNLQQLVGRMQHLVKVIRD